MNARRHFQFLLAIAVMAFCSTDSIAQKTVKPNPIVTMLNGRKTIGQIDSIDAVTVSIANQSVSIANMLRIDVTPAVSRTSSSSIPAASTSSTVVLTNNDRLHVVVEEVKDDALICRRFSEGPKFSIPLEYVRAFVLKRPRDSQKFADTIREISTHDARDDVVWLANGDRLTGELLEVSESNVELQTTARQLKLPRSGVQSVAMNVELAAELPTTERWWILLLNDGSTVSVTSLTKQKQAFEVEAMFGVPLTIEWNQVVSIAARGGRIVLLSDIKPSRFEYTPFISGQRLLQLNRNSNGGDLRLGGRRFPSGIGMYSRTQAAWDLEGKFESFVSRLGIDDSTAGRGNAIFRILVDGKQRFERSMTGIETSTTGLIDVGNAKQMSLEVDFGLKGDLWDVADWCEPVLIRQLK